MKGDGSVKARRGPQTTRGKEFRQELRVMLNLVMTAELRILVQQSVVAVRTGGHNLPGVVRIERSDIVLSEVLEKELVAKPAGLIASATFQLAENCVVDPGRFHQLNHAARHVLRAWIKCSRATNPVKKLVPGVRFDCRHTQAIRPPKPFRIRPAIRIEPIGNVLH